MIRSIVESVYNNMVKNPDKIALADEFSKISYKEYWEKINILAQFFLSKGIKKKDILVIEAQQNINYLIVEMAIQLCGGIFVPLEKNCSENRIKEIYELTKASILVSNKKIEDTICIDYNELKEIIDENSKTINFDFPNSEETAEILFTTGTTGKSKGIELTHGNDIALAENVRYGVEMEENNVELIPVPMNHSHGLRTFYGNMLNNGTVILSNGVLNINQFFKFIEDYKVTGIDLVPALLSLLLRLSKDKLGEYKNQLKYIQLGAAPLSENDKETLCKLLPNTRLYNFYGSTESGRTCILDFNKYKDKKFCIGKPSYNSKFIIVDDNNKPIRSSQDNLGYLATKGLMNMKGYYKDEDETKKIMLNGYIYSNDMAYIDKDGFVYLLGRKGDVINVGGKKVSPDEIENVAKKYDGIVDCACIPIEDKILGNVPKLFIQTSKQIELTEFRVFLSNNLEPYKIPKIIEMINKIPRAYNGKILRKDLKK